jgi:hypothetical protein
MNIDRFFTKTFTVSRMVWTNNKSEMGEVGTFLGHLQQATTELTRELGLAFGTAFTLWCPVRTNIEREDTIACGDYKYSVRGINERNYTGGNKHLEVTLQRNEI